MWARMRFFRSAKSNFMNIKQQPEGELVVKARVIVDNAENVWGDDLGIYFAIRGKNGELFPAKPIEFLPADEPDSPRPGATIKMECKSPIGIRRLQELMSDLWKIGIRPIDFESQGEIASTKGHLQDMRAIVQKVLEVKLP